jgi:hypothetical protein
MATLPPRTSTSPDPAAGSGETSAGGEATFRLDIPQVREILPHLIDALSDAVLVVDRDRNVVAANRRFVEVFGPESGHIAGRACQDHVACPENAASRGRPCASCDVLLQGEPRRVVRTLRDVHGQMRRWEGTLNPVRDGDTRVTHVVEVWRDITERTQLEAQLSHNERLASLGVLAAGVAHEINNPLASILAGVESMRRWVRRVGLDAASAVELEEIMDVLERETERSRETTDKLMLLAQPYQTAPGWVDLNRAAGDTLSLLRYQMRKQGVAAVDSLDPDLPRVWGKESAMRGVLMNLCINAVQAMPQGGTLTLRTARHGPDRVRIEVADTGHGIEPAHLDQIWNPFFTTKPVGKGTGLGLSITQRIVARHGGTISVESRPGEGARFTVDLPVHGPGGDHV